MSDMYDRLGRWMYEADWVMDVWVSATRAVYPLDVPVDGFISTNGAEAVTVENPMRLYIYVRIGDHTFTRSMRVSDIALAADNVLVSAIDAMWVDVLMRYNDAQHAAQDRLIDIGEWTPFAVGASDVGVGDNTTVTPAAGLEVGK